MADADPHAEIADLRQRLDEAESTLEAIREGEVDALVVGGREIYTLVGADHPYRVLVEAMQQGAVTLGNDGSIVYCNGGFGQMVQRSPENLIGIPIESLFASADEALLREQLLLTARSGSQAELTLKADDGTRLPVLVSFNVLPLEGASALCLVLTDLTEHRENLKLQDSDRRKDEFLAMLAHELRNPLAPIANAVQALTLWNSQTHQEVDWACEIVERQVSQLTHIVDDLLDVSRITQGKVKLQLAPTDVSAILSSAVETSMPLIASREHRLRTELPASPLVVQADFTRMAQVVTNLLNNAAKYTENGGDILLASRRDGSDVLVSVRDNGMGLPPDILPRVFDLFTQADRTIDRSQGGLGIGLTLVHRLMELHGGHVSAASDGPGRGSEFTLRLPLWTETPEPAPTDSRPSPSTAQAADQRILVVDDNQDSASTLAHMLKTMGHPVHIAHDGQAAIDAAGAFRPDLILLDIGLPVLNGFLVAERLRRDPAHRTTVIAALTGYGDEHDRRRSSQAGFDHHLVKPLNFKVLQDLIRTLPDHNDIP